jgi:hypothetical protein
MNDALFAMGARADHRLRRMARSPAAVQKPRMDELDDPLRSGRPTGRLSRLEDNAYRPTAPRRHRLADHTRRTHRRRPQGCRARPPSEPWQRPPPKPPTSKNERSPKRGQAAQAAGARRAMSGDPFRLVWWGPPTWQGRCKLSTRRATLAGLRYLGSLSYSRRTASSMIASARASQLRAPQRSQIFIGMTTRQNTYPRSVY